MADKKHNFTSTEIKAGAMVLAAVFVGLVMLLGAVNRPDLLEAAWSAVFGAAPKQRYIVKFEEASGLNENADVRYGGAKAGKVVVMGLDTEARRIVTAVEVDAAIPVNALTRASIAQATLTAEPHVELSVGAEGAPLLTPAEIPPDWPRYDGLPVIPTEEGGLFGSITTLAADLRALLGVEGRAAEQQELTTIADLIENVDLTVEDGREVVGRAGDELAGRSGQVEAILDGEVRDILENVKTATEDAKAVAANAKASTEAVNAWLDANQGRLSNTAASAESVAQDLEALTENLETYKQNVAAILENGEGLTADARFLLQRNGPAIDESLADLREAMRYFQHFAETVAENPQALIAGRREQGRPAAGSRDLGREPDRPDRK